jgi:hypothetical protein
LIVEAPNLWSCMPAAFATVTGVPIEKILISIGHDGSTIVFPDLPEPLNHRGFIGQEMCRALLEYGFCFATFDAELLGILDDEHYFTESEEHFAELLADSIGVIGCRVPSTGRLHSVAWDGHQCYDPTGFIRPLSYYEPLTYYRLGRS